MPELAEAALPDLGAAEVDTATSSAGGDAGAEEVTPSADVETAAAETSEASEQPTTETQEPLGDGRTIPADIRQHFSELKAQNPALYKKLKGLFFAEREFRTHFPGGPQEALKLKQFVENVGGEEGWQQVQNDANDHHTWAQQYLDGDPQWVEDLVKESPESLPKHAPKILEHWAALDSPGYQYHLGRIVLNTLNGSPVAEAYRALMADEKTKAIGEKLGAWHNGIEELAQKVPQKQVDPERQKLEKERADFEQERRNAYEDKVRQEMRGFYNQKLNGALEAEFKARGRDLAKLKSSNPKAAAAMINDAYGRVAQQLSQDQGFVSKFEALLKQGNGKAAAQLAQARAERLITNAAKETYSVFNMAGGAATQQKKDQVQANQQRANVPPTTKLSRRPEPEEIDWNRSDTSMVLDGKAYLKGRKELVTF